MSETRIPEALALLREKGWCKEQYNDLQGRHCILGALGVVSLADGQRVCRADKDALVTVLLTQYGRWNIADFNDDPATTFADVEAVLEKAALERGGSL